MLFKKNQNKMVESTCETENNDKSKQNDKHRVNKKKILIFVVILLTLVGCLLMRYCNSSDYSSYFKVSEYSLQNNGTYTLSVSDEKIDKKGTNLIYSTGESSEEYYEKYYSNDRESEFRIVYTVEDRKSSESIYTVTYDADKISQIIEDRIIGNINIESIKNYSYDSTTGKLDYIEETINNKTEGQSATSFTSFNYYFVNDKELVVENYVYTNESDTIKKTSAYFKEDILDSSLYQRLGINVSKDDTLFDTLFKNYFSLDDYGSECYIINMYQYLKVEENGINNLGYSYTNSTEFSLFENNKRDITGFSLKKDDSGEYSDIKGEQLGVMPENISFLKKAYYHDNHLQWIDCKDEDAAKKIYTAKYGQTSKAKDENFYNEFIEDNNDYVIVRDYEFTDESLLFKTLPLKLDDPIVESIQNSVIDYSIHDEIKNKVENTSESIDEMKQDEHSQSVSNEKAEERKQPEELLVDYLTNQGLEPDMYTILYGFNEGGEDVYQVMGTNGGTIGWYIVSSENATVSEYSITDIK